MEFNVKLQQLRKQKGLTQEQLAEQLYVSRTAVSKWETGKGYPNIDSLKRLAELFNITVDELLSGEQLIVLAEDENQKNMNQIFYLVCGILDLMSVLFLFLPLYGMQDGGMVRTVPLFQYVDEGGIRITYYILLLLMAPLGLVELSFTRIENEKLKYWGTVASLGLHIITVMLFMLSRQPYPSVFSFLLFLGKFLIMIKCYRRPKF